MTTQRRIILGLGLTAALSLGALFSFGIIPLGFGLGAIMSTAANIQLAINIVTSVLFSILVPSLIGIATDVTANLIPRKSATQKVAPHTTSTNTVDHSITADNNNKKTTTADTSSRISANVSSDNSCAPTRSKTAGPVIPAKAEPASDKAQVSAKAKTVSDKAQVTAKDVTAKAEPASDKAQVTAKDVTAKAKPASGKAQAAAHTVKNTPSDDSPAVIVKLSDQVQAKFKLSRAMPSLASSHVVTSSSELDTTGLDATNLLTKPSATDWAKLDPQFLAGMHTILFAAQMAQLGDNINNQITAAGKWVSNKRQEDSLSGKALNTTLTVGGTSVALAQSAVDKTKSLATFGKDTSVVALAQGAWDKTKSLATLGTDIATATYNKGVINTGKEIVGGVWNLGAFALGKAYSYVPAMPWSSTATDNAPKQIEAAPSQDQQEEEHIKQDNSTASKAITTTAKVSVAKETEKPKRRRRNVKSKKNTNTARPTIPESHRQASAQRNGLFAKKESDSSKELSTAHQAQVALKGLH